MASSVTIDYSLLLPSFASLSCVWYFLFSCQDCIDLQTHSLPDMNSLETPEMPTDILVGQRSKDRFGDADYQSKSPRTQERILLALYSS